MSFKIILFLLYAFLLSGCSENILYSGKIINNQADLDKILNKNQLIDKLGEPNYIDLIDNKYYYFSEKTVIKNFFNTKVDNRKMVVFNFNKDDAVISFNEFNLDNQKKISLNKNQTKNNLSKRGTIERIFGGVGKQQIPNTSQ